MLSRLFPRCGSQKDHDRIAATARQHSGGSAGGLARKFLEFDIECVDVLIGKPDTAEAGGKIETLLEQLRLRQLSIEQIETFERQRAAAESLRTLHESQALASMQTELTNSHVQVRINENAGEADLARARKQAEQLVVMAQANSRGRKPRAKAKGPGGCRSVCPRRPCCCKKSTASAIRGCLPFRWSRSNWPKASNRWCPSECSYAGHDGNGNGDPKHSVLGLLMNLLVAEKSGIEPTGDHAQLAELERLSQQFTRDAVANLAGHSADERCRAAGGRDSHGGRGRTWKRQLRRSHWQLACRRIEWRAASSGSECPRVRAAG